MNLTLTYLLGISVALILFSCRSHSFELKYETNILEAKKQSEIQIKPILIHFTGYGSSGVNEFMDKFMSSRSIQYFLDYEYITLQLFVDDKSAIKPNDTMSIREIFQSASSLERIKNAENIGDVNRALEMELLNGINTQPYYMIVDENLHSIVEPFGYINGDVKYFEQKLQEGLMAFSR